MATPIRRQVHWPSEAEFPEKRLNLLVSGYASVFPAWCLFSATRSTLQLSQPARILFTGKAAYLNVSREITGRTRQFLGIRRVEYPVSGSNPIFDSRTIECKVGCPRLQVPVVSLPLLVVSLRCCQLELVVRNTGRTPPIAVVFTLIISSMKCRQIAAQPLNPASRMTKGLLWCRTTSSGTHNVMCNR